VRTSMRQQLFLHQQLVYFASSRYQACVLMCAMQVFCHWGGIRWWGQMLERPHSSSARRSCSRCCWHCCCTSYLRPALWQHQLAPGKRIGAQRQQSHMGHGQACAAVWTATLLKTVVGSTAVCPIRAACSCHPAQLGRVIEHPGIRKAHHMATTPCRWPQSTRWLCKQQCGSYSSRRLQPWLPTHIMCSIEAQR
jgi:hypothetical protein